MSALPKSQATQRNAPFSVSGPVSGPEEPTSSNPREPRDLRPQPGTSPRLVTDLLSLVLLTCWQPLSNATIAVGALYGLRTTTAMWWVEVDGQLLAAAATGAWLVSLVIRRTASTPRRRAQRGTATVMAAAATATAATNGNHLLFPSAGAVCFAVATVWTAVEVCRRHRVGLADLGIRPPDCRTAAARIRGWDVGVRTVLACTAGGLVTGVLTVVLQRAGGTLPVMQGTQEQLLGYTTAWQWVCAVIGAVAAEDVVIVAAVAALLTAGRRPRWQIYLVVCAIEVWVHAYFGAPAVGMALYAGYRVHLYLKYRRLTPLIIGHAVYDLVLSLNTVIPASEAAWARVVMIWGCVLAAACFTLVRRSGRGSAPAAAVAE